jgi:cephalosporin hydroxylase
MTLVHREGAGPIGQLRWRFRLIGAFLAQMIYRPTSAVADEYHKWYFGSMRWMKNSWAGIPCWKFPTDMWSYQEILQRVKPSLVIEFGSLAGGSAVFFADVMRNTGQPFKVLSVDVSHKVLDPAARQVPDIEFLESSSTIPAVAEHIQRLKEEYPGKIFAILDSEHAMDHVLAEMKLLRPLLSAGDYLVVEDTMLNGHPVLPLFGPGPYEAVEAYEREFPHDYRHDVDQEKKFGFTAAPNGFLIRK